jgi:hypothetical protein
VNIILGNNKMIAKNMIKAVVTFLIFNIASASYATCIQEFFVLRHGEDYSKQEDISSPTVDPTTYPLTPEGRAHVIAYKDLFSNTSSQWIGKLLGEDICPIGQIIISDSKAPRATAEPIALALNLKIQKFNKNTNWSTFLQNINLKKNKSVLMISTRQILWALERGQNSPDNNSLLINFLNQNDTADRNKIIVARSPQFNYLYEFKNLQTGTKTFFQDVGIYIQKVKVDTNTLDQCFMRLTTGKSSIEIAALTLMPEGGYDYINKYWNCN